MLQSAHSPAVAAQLSACCVAGDAYLKAMLAREMHVFLPVSEL